MPRGFLVKRQKFSNAFSYRARHNSEEDRSDSGSEPENLYATTHAFGSPDSGYCHSPVSLTFKDPGARLLATTYPEVNTVNAGSTGGRTVPELMPLRKEVSEEEMQPMDYSTSVTTSTTTTNHIDNRSSQGRSSTGPLQDVNDNTGRSHAVPRHPADHLARSALEETVSIRYPGVDLTRGFNLNADLYSQVKYHHPLLQYPGGPAFTNGRFPMPPLAAPGAAQEEVMMDTGRPESTCSSSPRSSPAPSVGTPTHTQQGSPFYFSNFDRLSVSSPGGPGSKNAASSTSNKPSSAPGTPGSPGKKRGASTQNGTGESKPKTPKKSKAVRKIKFELEDKSSPVSGTFIRDVDDMTDSSGGTVVCGDIDSAFNLVEVTPEARQELERIENKIGDYVCQLCKEFYTDAFQLAQHKCSRIVHIEYRCPECDKLFNCPANLASHRRWHKPRPANNNNNNNNNNKGSSNNSNNNNNNNNKNNNSISVDMSSTTKTMEQTALAGQTMVEGGGVTRKTPSPGADSNEGLFECEQCGKKFRRQAYLRKHVASHADEQPYPCQFCGKVLRSETARAKHVLQHAIGAAPVGAKDFPCGVCAAIFPSRPALERHARLHTSEVYPCKYCSNTFYSSPGLTRHINKCHPSENRQVILLQMPVNRPC